MNDSAFLDAAHAHEYLSACCGAPPLRSEGSQPPLSAAMLCAQCHDWSGFEGECGAVPA
jgi:hypothetical protein